MKFPHINSAVRSFEREIKLDGGLNTSVAPMVLSETALSECNNMIFDNGLLKTREGFYTDEDMVISGIDTQTDDIVWPLKILQQSFCCDRGEFRLGYLLTGDMVSFRNLNVYRFFSDNSYVSAGNIRFGRIDDETFYIPLKCNFFKGKATSGCGIYLFCEMFNCEQIEDRFVYYIYELSSDFTTWNRLYESDFYIPTVYYNGRGNMFSNSSEYGNDEYKKPIEPESHNMLSGYFYSYFSVDGSSYSFQLPVGRLDNAPLVCTLSFKIGATYTWTIPANENSAEVNMFGNQIALEVNRRTGLLTFWKGSEHYPLPILFRDSVNNLRVLAHKDITDDIRKAAGSARSVTYKSSIVLYGNDKEPNAVYVASTENPLYFPKNAAAYIGAPDEKITAVRPLGDSLIAVKENAVYALKISDGKLVFSEELIDGTDKSYYAPQNVSVNIINPDVGCAFPESIISLENYLVFKSKFKVYAINKSGKCLDVSYPIAAAAEEATDYYNRPIGFVYRGFYGITIGQKAYIADIINAEQSGAKLNAVWYEWSLPEGVALTSSTDFEGRPIFVFGNTMQKLQYICIISGSKDVVLNLENGEISEIKTNVGGYFKTSFFDTDAVKIEAVTLNAGAADSLNIEVDTYYTSIEFSKNLNLSNDDIDNRILKKIAVYPSLKSNKASIKVSGDNLFYLDTLKLLYR